MQLNKILIAASLLFLSNQSIAAGPYDGIWEFDPFGYATVNETDGQMIIVIVFNDEYGGIWNASRGFRNDNKARVRQIVGLGYSELDVEVKTDTVAEITQVTCIGPVTGQPCPFPNGHKFTAKKVW